MPRLVPPVLPPGSLSRLAQPVLHEGGLTLRPWAAEDLPAVVAAYSDPAIMQWHARSMTEPEAQEWIEHWPQRWARESGAGWAVELHGRVSGQISMRHIVLDEGLVELSYWILPEARGQGAAPAALGALTRWMFEGLGVARAELCHSTRNQASCRVAVKSGYLPEGTALRQALHPDGWHDMHQHARLNSSFHPSHTPTGK
ncbi:GNAT family N-acetyltransferase [Nonomuraea basaltis]|uniref:GNAT family N-acetyltransferase n=1 Tax=Nonomuraea basaltis TaxID=2495887 RepID=UPI00110C50E6|nr:GNAT family N-acetyltransferase [Nonomuraea basaltis]TMR96328.1 GNAT family N-acetyltransferase [Nonomuraea basaltis]